MQLLQGFGPLGTGVRILPVALSIAVGSVLGTRLAVSRVGTKVVVFVGLVMMAAAFAWINVIDLERRLPGDGCSDGAAGRRPGLTTAPATDSIMGGATRAGRRRVGCQRRDPSRWAELWGRSDRQHLLDPSIRQLTDSPVLQALPAPVRSVAEEGLAQGLAVAAQSPGPASVAVRDTVTEAFLSGMGAGCPGCSGDLPGRSGVQLAAPPAHPVRSQA